MKQIITLITTLFLASYVAADELYTEYPTNQDELLIEFSKLSFEEKCKGINNTPIKYDFQDDWIEKNTQAADIYLETLNTVAAKCNTPELSTYAYSIYEYNENWRNYILACSNDLDNFSNVDILKIDDTYPSRNNFYTIDHLRIIKTHDDSTIKNNLNQYNLIEGFDIEEPQNKYYLMKAEFIPCDAIVNKRLQ